MKCPVCWSEIPAGVKFCPICGQGQELLQVSDSAAAQQENPAAVEKQGAGAAIRAVAIIIDWFVLLPVSFVIAALFGTTDHCGFELNGLGFYSATLLSFAYFIFLEGKLGTTLGKMAVGLQVVKTDGSPCDLRAAVIRTICRLVDGILCYLVGAIFIWATARRQRLGDMLAGTIVIKTEK